MGSATDDMVDTRDMLVVHTALLRELRLAPTLVEGAAAKDPRRITVVADHLQFLLGLLTHHHDGEDRLLWPKLRARLPDPLIDVVALMEAQHAEIETLTATVAEALAGWQKTPAAGTHLAEALRRLHTALEQHLHVEEQEILPLAALHLTEAEWQEIGEAAIASIPKPKLPVVFGMMMYEGDPTVLRMMLAPAPLLPRTLVPRIAPGAYARYARRIHNTPRP